MYYDHNKFKRMISEKLKEADITPPEPTDEEYKNMYQYWLTQETDSFEKFFNSFKLTLIDVIIDDNYEIYRQIEEAFTNEEIVEYLIKEKHIYKGAFQLSKDLWLIRI